MQPLHVLIDISALAAAVGAGAFLLQTRGRLRSAEAKRNALQSRLSELEDQRTNKIAEADATSAAVQATTEKLLEIANKRVSELEKTLQAAEKLKRDADSQKQDIEKLKTSTAKQQQDVEKLKQDAETYRLAAEKHKQDADKLKVYAETQRQDASRQQQNTDQLKSDAEKQQRLDALRIEALEASLAKLTRDYEEEKAKPKEAIIEPLPLRSRSSELTDGILPRSPISPAKKTISVVLVGASRESRFATDIEKYLVDAEYKVIRATSMENIQTTAREAQPDLAILDLQIAGGDSLTALEVFKSDAELRDIPTIVICALKDREKAIELGAAGCVVPPITSNVLLSTVKTAVINHRKRMERSRLAKIANTGDRSAALSAAE